jgi:dGTPase
MKDRFPLHEEETLAPFAMTSAASRGRRYAETEHPYRSAFMRDRDRVVHSRAFRRLEYKTQVFVNHEGDHYRTRLTHSIEVSQIARTVSRALGLNADLAECLSLAHDLGHTPFGHLGEEVLRELMKDDGGFDHNRQSLRIVDRIEERYAEFPGLNLTFETREGIAKHAGSFDPGSCPEYAEFDPSEQPPLEAQMIDVVDEIGYNHHDIDDGLESRLLDLDELCAEVPLFGEAHARARALWPAADRHTWINAALRHVIDLLVSDLIRTTKETIARLGLATVGDVRSGPAQVVALSPGVAAANRTLKKFLNEHLYHHHRLERMRDKYRRILIALFTRYRENPLLLPDSQRRKLAEEGAPRLIADYIAGMTDRYALDEYRRLFDPYTKV